MALRPIKDTTDLIFVTSPAAVTPDYAPSFYRTSTFRITEPEHGLAFLRAVRPDNLAHIRRLSVFVEAFYATNPPGSGNSTTKPSTAPASAFLPEPEPELAPLPFWVPQPDAPLWYALLDGMRDRLPGLRELEIYLHAELTGYHQDIPRLGAGNDPDFARRLAGLKVLEKLELDGFFAREWPAYLERELGLGGGGDSQAARGESVWSSEGRTEAYLKLLGRYQGYCPPREL